MFPVDIWLIAVTKDSTRSYRFTLRSASLVSILAFDVITVRQDSNQIRQILLFVSCQISLLYCALVRL